MARNENDLPENAQQQVPMILPGQAPGGQPPVAVVEQPAKLIRIASMIRELLEDVRQSKPDEAGRKRLREIYERALTALKEGVSKELQDELETLTLPLENTPSESEVRLAQAQLLGWLEGLFQGIQATMFAQQMMARQQLEQMRQGQLPPGTGMTDRNWSGTPTARISAAHSLAQSFFEGHKRDSIRNLSEKNRTIYP